MGGTMQSTTQSATHAVHRGGLALGRGALHAWLVDLDAPGAATAARLDAAERGRAASFVGPQDGARFAASHAALRLVLAHYVGGEPHDLEFRVGPHGQPRLAADEVRFSLARSGGLALIAVSRGPVGADLERVAARSGLADVAAARFPGREAACIAAGCSGSPSRSFYRHWTAKEAYLKAIGLGLAGLRDTELVCGAQPVIWFAGRPVAGWQLSVASRVSGYVAAIIGEPVVTSWRWLSSGRALPPERPAGSHR
jgi:4'-phosphopantetheinyl transferase